MNTTFLILCLAACVLACNASTIHERVKRQQQAVNQGKQQQGQQQGSQLYSKPPMQGQQLSGANAQTQFRSQLDAGKQGMFDKVKGNKNMDIGKMQGQTANRMLGVMNKMPSNALRIVENIETEIGSMTPDMIRKGDVPLAVLAAMSDNTLAQMNQNMTKSQKEALCEAIVEKKESKDTTKSLLEGGFDCFDVVANISNIKMSRSQAKMFVDQKRQQKPPNKWNKEDWGSMMKLKNGLQDDDITNMQDSVMRDLVANGMIRDFKPKTGSQRKELQKKVRAALGEADTWTNKTIVELGKGMEEMEASDLEKIPIAELKKAASHLGDLQFTDRAKKAAFAGRFLASMETDKADQWNTDNIKNCLPYMADNPTIVKKLDGDKLIDAIGDMPSGIKGNFIIKKLLATSNYSDPKNVDAQALKKLKNVAKDLPLDFWDKLPDASVLNALSDLKDTKFPRSAGRKILSKASISNYSSFDINKVKELKNLMNSMDSNNLKSIPNDALVGAVDALKDQDFDVAQGRTIVEKFAAANNNKLGPSAKSMGKLGKHTQPAEIDGLTYDDLDLGNESSTLEMDVDKATAMKIIAKIKNELGAPGPDNTNYTAALLAKWGKIVAKGMAREEIQALPEDDSLPTILETLADNFDDMDDGQVKACTAKARSYLQVDDSTAVGNLEDVDIEQAGPFLRNLNDTDLDKFNKTMRPVIARVIGEHKIDKLPRDELVRLKKFSMKNVKRDDTGQVTDRTNTASIDSNDVQQMGNLVCGFEKTDVQKLSKDALEAKLETLSKCPSLPKDVEEAVTTRATSQISDLLTSAKGLVRLGPLARRLTQAQVDSISQDVMAEAISDIVDSLKERKDEDDKRNKAGFKDEKSDEDRSSDKTGESRIIQRGLQALQSASRKRRTTTATTCNDVQTMGSSATSLTSSQISGMSSTDFSNCAETFGALSGWDSSQLSALTTQAKAVWGAVSTWTTEEVRQAGSMLQGLTSSEISTVDLNSNDAVASTGKHSGYDSSQLAAAFARWLNQARSDTASSVTSNDLQILGNFACGATTTHINDLSTSAYSNAASSIGTLSTCESTQLSAYATKAKAAYGSDVSTWSTATITTSGSVIGGLTKSDLSSLSSSQIAVISTTTISQIPPATFAGFTSSQLGGFTSGQANAVTANQQASLDTSQKDALTAAGAPAKTVTGSGGHFVECSMLLVAIMAVLVKQW